MVFIYVQDVRVLKLLIWIKLLKMCKKVNNKKIPNTRIDKCMKHLIDILQHRGVRTISCCCGHGKYPMSIIIKQGLTTDYYSFEIMSQKVIPRKRNFYKRDKQGYYYIPEVEKKFK